MRETVIDAAVAAGRPQNAVAINYNAGVLVSDRARPNGAAIVGPPETVIERLLAFRDVGVTSFTFWPLTDEHTQRERLMHEIIPHLRTL
jgi:alkanesulfonate monooxygenase SsuD/methylene tetrahydromethanopterin reductase-like flavin-dependent oxidoreductase (luciferase family)